MGKNPLLIIVVISFIVSFVGLGSSSVFIVDESRNAQCAWEMLQANELVVPTFNGRLRGDKPPLHYWFMQLAYLLFGKSAFAARFFSSLMAVVLTVSVYLFGEKLFNRQTGVWAAVILSASLYLPLQLRLATPDPYLISFFFFAMTAFWWGWKDGEKRYHYLGYALLGVASLAKGPVAPVMAALSIGIFLLLQREFKVNSIREFRPFTGLLIILLIATPWYVWVHIETDGAFTQAFFLEHNVARFQRVKEGHGGSFWVIPVMMFVSLLPFSLFIPQAYKSLSGLNVSISVRPIFSCNSSLKISLATAMQIFRSSSRTKFASTRSESKVQTSSKSYRRKRGAEVVYLLSIVLAFIIFFTFSRTKLPSYPSPSYPFFALLLAPGLAAIARGEFRIQLWQSGIILVIALAVPIASYGWMSSVPDLHEIRNWSWLLLLVPVGILVSLGYLIQKRPAKAMAGIAASFILLHCLVLGVVFPKVDARNHVQQSLHLLDDNRPVIAYHQFTQSYTFYHGKPIEVIKVPDSLFNQIHRYESIGLRPLVITIDRRKNDIDCLPGLIEVFTQKDLFEYPVTSIFSYENESSH